MNSWRITPKPYTQVKMISSSIAISQLLSKEEALTFFIQLKDLYVQGLKFSSLAISQLLSEVEALMFFIQPKDLYVQGLKNIVKSTR